MLKLISTMSTFILHSLQLQRQNQYTVHVSQLSMGLLLSLAPLNVSSCHLWEFFLAIVTYMRFWNNVFDCALHHHHQTT